MSKLNYHFANYLHIWYHILLAFFVVVRCFSFFYIDVIYSGTLGVDFKLLSILEIAFEHFRKINTYMCFKNVI